MKLYVVKNDDGKLWDYDDERWSANAAGDYTTYEWAAWAAEITAEKRGGHVVELVEKPELVEVSEEEGEFLKGISYDMCVSAAAQIRAYFNGWTVEKPKRYVVYQILPGSHIGDDAIQAIKHTDNTSAVAWMFAESANLGKFSDRLFTLAEIKHYGLQDCEKVEVHDE